MAEPEQITLTISHRQTPHDFTFPPDAKITALFESLAATLQVPAQNQKLFVGAQLIKYPPKDPDAPLRDLVGKKMRLVGSTTAEDAEVQKISNKVAARDASRGSSASKLSSSSRRNQITSSEDSKYTFLQVRPLMNLPSPERSRALLMRLKEDPGIKAAMKKHKFTVSLLTEMEPLSHTQTSHEGTSRILGLNRNKGEVVELRLRTDAYDGYRDYKTIRKTLCHELAHNVHGDHDRHFWDLCHQIEREVEAADWKSGGHTIGETSRYAVSGREVDEEDHQDHGGWSGGEFVLGGSGVGRLSQGLSRREILAEAALERQRREAQAEGSASGCKKPSTTTKDTQQQ